MSAVKIFALGVLVTGTLASSTLAGSIRGGPHSHAKDTGRISTVPTSLTYATPVVTATPAKAAPILAEANLAGDSSGSGSSNSETPTAGGLGGNSGGLVLATSGSSQARASNGPLQRYVGNPIQPPTSNSSGSSSDSSPSSQPTRADAFINFGNGPFTEARSLTTGNAQAFTSSPAFNQFYKNGASSQDVANFENQVISTIQKTYADAGLPIHLTTNSADPAAHTMSLVSGASNPQSPDAIGITDVGNNGFSFIDKFAGAQDPTALATAIGHNLAHELMHAFGLANHPEATGSYVDAASTTLSSLTDPNEDFSPAAANLLSTLNFQATGQTVTAGSTQVDGNQILVSPSASVPEPTTVALWGVLAGVAGLARRRGRRSA